MEVHCDEGLATRIGPEPCVAGREAGDEALAGERIGQSLSRERYNRSADAVCQAEGETVARAIASVRPAPRGHRKGAYAIRTRIRLFSHLRLLDAKQSISGINS